MKCRTSLIALTLLALMIFAGCSRHLPDVAAPQPENIDFASLTNSMKTLTSEPIVKVEKIDSNFIRFVVTTGSKSQPPHYVATWIRSRWSINRLVK